MEQQLDFMKQPIEQLREIIQDYNVFCRTAEKLEWINIKEQYKMYQLNYTIIDFGVYEFPNNYRILSHIMNVYARTVLSCMAYYEGGMGFRILEHFTRRKKILPYSRF